MQQNINLLSALSLPPVVTLSVRIILKLLVLWICLLMGIYAIGFWQNNLNNTKLKAITETKVALSTKINALSSIVRSGNGASEQAAATAPASTQTFGAVTLYTKGFAQHLFDLATYMPEGVWLESFELSQPNNDVILKGNAITPYLITVLLKDLEEKSVAFDGVKFNTFRIGKFEKGNAVNFLLQTAKTPETSSETTGTTPAIVAAINAGIDKK